MQSSSLNNMCRCCATEGAFKDIKTSYVWMGEEEVYGDMLRECFDVTLTALEQGGICEVCITQLRNAANFKKQVLTTESQFKKHLQNKTFKNTQVKEELSGFEENDSEDNDMDNVDDEDYVPDYDVPIKTESDTEEKPKKRSAKAPATRAKKSKSNDESNVKTKKLPKPKAPKSAQKKKRVITITPESSRVEKTVHVVFKTCAELGKHQTNIRTILLCSNATPIRRYGGVGYMCCFCPQEFRETSELKTHTLQSHNDTEKMAFMKTQTLPGYMVKLDITDLKCTLCHTPFEVLDDFTSHLISEHEKTFHTNIKSHILPFKFDADMPRCVICETQFNNFKILLQHMNVHFRNHVCDTCGLGFVNVQIFQKHMLRHETGVFNCSYCTKVYDTRVKCKEHERSIHILMNKRNKCGFCGEKFNDYRKKIEHEVKNHGVKPLVLNCLACSKTFNNQRALTAHKKSHQKT